jgi:FMN phosphatase YigB (HAD superfamily)
MVCMLVTADHLDIGTRPICDFDGTIAVLPVSWTDLRNQLGVRSIEDLWLTDGHSGWTVVTAAERRAALAARPVLPVIRALTAATRYAVLTNNDETAVAMALDGITELEEIERLIVGRATLSASKRDPAAFERDYDMCREFLQIDAGAVVYVGDSDYEIQFARELGARPVAIGRHERSSL